MPTRNKETIVTDFNLLGSWRSQEILPVTIKKNLGFKLITTLASHKGMVEKALEP